MGKKIKTSLFLAFIGVVMTTLNAFSEMRIYNADSTMCLSPEGYGHFYFGQIVRGRAPKTNTQVNELWTQDMRSELRLKFLYKDFLEISTGVSVKLFFSYPIAHDKPETKFAYPQADMGLTYAKLQSSMDKPVNLGLQIGYFPFKYNPDAKNLGETMFRSGTYPAALLESFDYAQTKLLGAKVNLGFFENSLKCDVLMTSEAAVYPLMDWSLTGILSYDIANRGVFQLGLGYNKSHLISVYTDDYSTNDGNPTDPGQAVANKSIREQYKYYIIDTLNDGTYDTVSGFYTYRGDKAMARFSFDPKEVFTGMKQFMTKDELKIYCEATIIGTKSYPDNEKNVISYENWKEKMPVAFGINLPSFGIVDMFNLEFEWFGSKYPNSWVEPYGTSQSRPFPSGGKIMAASSKESYWKWSTYIKKSFADEHLGFVLQLARDHSTLGNANYNLSYQKEILQNDGDWWWAFKTYFAF